MSDPSPVASRRALIESEVSLHFSRSGGAGGQNVNKVSTKVRLEFPIARSRAFSDEEKSRIFTRLQGSRFFDQQDGCIVIISQEHRTQGQNRENCIEKLLELLARLLVREKRRKPTKKTRSSQRKRLDAKKIHSTKKSIRQSRPE